jgi:hypothetical protein
MSTELVFEKLSGPLRRHFLIEEMDGLHFEIKQPCRDVVRQFLLSNHFGSSLRLMSMPGALWAFERQIETAYEGKCDFCGVEREIGVLRKGIGWMPGARPSWFQEEFKTMSVRGVRTECARIFHADLCDLSAIVSRDAGSNQRRGFWVNGFKSRTAIWLDFTSMICRDVEFILSRISNVCDFETAEVPIAVTLMKAREPSEINRKMRVLKLGRHEYLSAILDGGKYRRFVLDDVYEYQSKCVPMFTILGRLFLR